MRKLLIATTALTLAGGAAFAELSMSGSAELGMDYDSEEAVKHTFVHQLDIDFAGSGTTDGGLSFGGSVGFDTAGNDDNADAGIDTGTVFVSGSFGTLTIGGNDAADLLAGGVADVGMNVIGVDDAGESLRGSTAAQLRYDQSFGAASIAVTAGNKEESGDDNPYAVGLSFSAGDITIGVGYDSNEVVSLGAGYSVANISVNGFYSSHSKRAGNAYNDNAAVPAVAPGPDGDKGKAATDAVLGLGTYTSKANTIGADLTYTLGATALTVAFSKLDVKGATFEHQPVDDDGNDDGSATNYSVAGSSISSVGVGITHDLGGGASVNAGFGKVETFGTGLVAAKAVKNDDKADVYAISTVIKESNKASIGITLKF